MDTDKVKELSEKVKNGTATSAEELELFQLLNQGVEELRESIKEVMVEEN
jgi:hypothetical protein